MITDMGIERKNKKYNTEGLQNGGLHSRVGISLIGGMQSCKWEMGIKVLTTRFCLGFSPLEIFGVRDFDGTAAFSLRFVSV